MTFDPCYTDALELLDRYRRREVSPVEVLEAQLRRVDEVDGELGAIIERMDGEALTQARESERRYRDGDARPLDGITVAVKEKHAIAGHRVTEGSLAWDGIEATTDHPTVERLRAAGAVFHARTATPEFSITTYTQSRKWGVTRNPWDPQFSPGGSSGGAGAALAAGMTTLATASDIGGSTRGPAAFTGTVGYKAPYGRVPGSGPTSLDYYRGDGALARTVGDALCMTNLISGQHRLDQASLPDKRIDAGRDVTGMRVAYSPDLDGYTVDSRIAANTAAMVDELVAAGCVVEPIAIGWSLDDLRTATAGHFAQMMSANVDNLVGDRTELLSDYTSEYLKLMTEVRKHLSMFDAVRAEYTLQQTLAAAMDGFDALICPTTAAVGFVAGDNLFDGVEIEGQRVSWTEGMLTIPFNVNNRCPVLAVPSGFAGSMPTGVQLVGHPYDDDTVFALGRALEERRGRLFESRVPEVGVAKSAAR
ncbi:amidase family protein [Gordonia sp. CPCC 205515]|uniref:amidase n=1 Tax=Gordonia sp. CPCC 205515 TaxID=3140791 RepID=UPI003AF3FD0D